MSDYPLPRRDDDLIIPPTAAETQAILEHASPHLVRAILLSYYLGLRPGTVELLTLIWDQVLWDREAILILSAHKGGPEKRMVPIHPGLMSHLRAWHEQDEGEGPIVHYHGRPIRSLKTAWRGALQRAGIKRRLRMYDLRHNFVTQALKRGADIKAVAEIAGSRADTLMRFYQHVSTELRRQTVAK
ncbi:MAG: site-specific integrase, partial [Deltaproteobacteria bacterium]|nr:site-specific integrase [Deltaproteobacteria bacterium]